MGAPASVSGALRTTTGLPSAPRTTMSKSVFGTRPSSAVSTTTSAGTATPRSLRGGIPGAGRWCGGGGRRQDHERPLTRHHEPVVFPSDPRDLAVAVELRCLRRELGVL